VVERRSVGSLAQSASEYTCRLNDERRKMQTMK